jgi:enoyl-CoA hydratase/carnithine racemase
MPPVTTVPAHTTDAILREEHGGVVTLVLNRPEKLNALTAEMFVMLKTNLEDVAARPNEIGCVVLTGAGKSFCAGKDLGEVGPRPAGEESTAAASIDLLEAIPQPTVGAVRGHCYTGGLELLLACDLVVASDTAVFVDTHSRFGLVAGLGMSVRLPERIGGARAREMMFTGRPVRAAEAQAYGLVNLVVPDDELERSVTEITAQIIANSWHTHRAYKALMARDRAVSRGDALARVVRREFGRDPDYAARVAAFRKKRSKS